jgi:S-adenosylmethionine:tRNA ribosyltransferase-isomerase
MKTEDFSFNLPEELVAQKPPSVRGADRLMLLDRETRTIKHAVMDDLPALLPERALLVFNDSRVRKARLYGKLKHGGNIDTPEQETEFLLVNQTADTEWTALCKKTKRKKTGSVYGFPAGVEAELTKNYPLPPPTRGYTADTAAGADIAGGGETAGLVRLRFSRVIDDAYLDEHGHIPLPSYIKRTDDGEDVERYQNVFAGMHGSIAAPTAGLHFTEDLFTKIHQCGIETAFLTLHVGLGTFLPVRAEYIEDHRMHEESYTISGECAERVNRALLENRPVVACGTTSLRCLESAVFSDSNGKYLVKAGTGRTRIFIYPGYKFRVVRHLFTNFHTPRSTLLMLVSALCGKDFIMSAYSEAVKERYRFFSYGDAMLIL